MNDVQRASNCERKRKWNALFNTILINDYVIIDSVNGNQRERVDVNRPLRDGDVNVKSKTERRKA